MKLNRLASAANAGVCDEFLLGILPPDHGGNDGTQMTNVISGTQKFWVSRQVCFGDRMKRVQMGQLGRCPRPRPTPTSLASLSTFLRGFPQGVEGCGRGRDGVEWAHVATSLLYPALGIPKTYRYVRTEYQQGAIWFTVRPEGEPEGCPHCQGQEFVGHGHRERQVRIVPIGLKPVWVKAAVSRYRCKGCGQTWERLAKDYAHIRLKDLRRLAIDEIYLGRKQKYLTRVIRSGAGADRVGGRGRACEALHGFWRRPKASGAEDRGGGDGPYASTVARHLPNALIVFDRFHMMKLMNEKLDDLRRQLVREAETEDAQVAIKGTRWLLLYRREHLPKNKAGELQKALDLNRPLATAYLLKEELALAWEQASWEAMANFCCAWCEKAIASGLDQLIRMAQSLTDHAEGLLSYTVTKMTSGRMEGINRKIKTLLRQVYGFRDDDFLRLKLYALHESKHKLVG